MEQFINMGYLLITQGLGDNCQFILNVFNVAVPSNMDDDQVCPRCKTSKYRNPSMKLMVNVCGHPLCENCVNLLFAKGTVHALTS